MDGLVLVDALAAIMGHEEKELCKPGHLAMVLILDTATTITGSFWNRNYFSRFRFRFLLLKRYGSGSGSDF
jgi:hypothetical protein